jgi:hypothetical protein
LEEIWKEAVVVLLEVLHVHFDGVAEEYYYNVRIIDVPSSI